jgi:hypothetical protein
MIDLGGVCLGMLGYRIGLYAASRISRKINICSASTFASAFGLGSVYVSSVFAAALYEKIYWEKENKEIKTELGISGLIGVIWFKAVGGKLNSICGSDLFRAGGFAKDFVLVVRDGIVSKSQKSMIQKIGMKFGCHSCGRSLRIWERRFIADHVPPTNFKGKVEQGVDSFHVQKLFPHCPTCAGKQGNAVATGKRTIVPPSLWTIRPEYLWMPIIPLYRETSGRD